MSNPIPYPNLPAKDGSPIARSTARVIEAGQSNAMGTGEGYSLTQHSQGTTIAPLSNPQKSPMSYKNDFNIYEEYWPNEIVRLTASIDFTYTEPFDSSTQTGTTAAGTYICIKHVPHISQSAAVNAYCPEGVRQVGILYYPIDPSPQTTGSLTQQGAYWKQLGGGGSSGLETWV